MHNAIQLKLYLRSRTGERSASPFVYGEALSEKWFDLVMLGIATWRISSLLVDEDGPFDIFVKFRSLIGLEYDSVHDAWVPSNGFASLFSCVWCVSVWIGTGFYLLYAFLPDIWHWIVIPLVLSTVAIIIDVHLEDET